MGNVESAREVPLFSLSENEHSQASSDHSNDGTNENRTPNVKNPNQNYSEYKATPPKGLAPPGKYPERGVNGANVHGNDDDADSTISALIGASAAVFHLLSNTEDSGHGSFDDDVSIVDMSAAVFELLQHEASSGNEKPIRQFLETAQVVSDVLLHEKYDRSPPSSRTQVEPSTQRTTQRLFNDDDNSDGQRRDAIYRALASRTHGKPEVRLTETHGKPEDRNPPSGRPPSRVHLRDVDDGGSVVSEMSHSIFKVLDETKARINEEKVAEFSAAVYELLDKDKQNEDNNGGSVVSLSERSAAVFNALETNQPDATHDAPPPSDATFVSHLIPKSDPKNLIKRNIFHILALRQNQPYDAIDEEEEEDEEDDLEEEQEEREEVIPQPPQVQLHTSPLPQNEQSVKIEEQYVPQEEPIHSRMEVEPQQEPTHVRMEAELESPGETSNMNEPITIFSEEIYADTTDQEIQEEIDLVFVERFDEVFNELIGLHPKFLLTNPDLVRHLRITKLQRLLEHMDDCESRLLTQISRTLGEKQMMENELSRELTQANRSKAVYQIQLQSGLNVVTQKTLFKQAQTTWKIVSSSEAKAKKEYLHEQGMKQKRDTFLKDNASGVPTREQLLQLLPEDAEGKALKAAISATPKFLSVDPEQLDQMRKYQVENAFMASEIAVLKKKLAHVEAQSKQLAWVDSLLLRLDKVQMATLKNKFTHKLGVVSLD